MKTHSLIAVFSLFALSACGPGGEEESLCNESGVICTFAGVPLQAQLGPDDVKATKSPLFMPQDIVFMADGTAYLPDFNAHRLRTIDPKGIITTISGTGFLGDGPEGDSDYFAWNHPTGLAVDPNDPNILHVSAWHNSRINQVDLSTGLTTFEAGTGGRDYAWSDDPMGAVFDLPSSVAFDSKGNLYISDQANQAIRRITPAGELELVAGSPGEDNAAACNAALGPDPDPADMCEDATAGYAGDGGPAIDALLYAEIGQAADPSNKIDIGPDDRLYLADSANNTVRVIDLNTGIIDRVAGIPWHRTTSALDDLPPATDPTAGDGGSALDAYVNNPRDVAVGIDGELYIADTDNNCIRVVQPDGTIETFAGTCGSTPEIGAKWTGEEVPATEAEFNAPYGVSVDHDGNVYVADTKNHVIRRVAY